MTSCSHETGGPRSPLCVRVNDEFTPDAGCCVDVAGPGGPARVVLPPAMTLFHQVLAYLKDKTDPVKRPSGSMVGREGCPRPKRGVERWIRSFWPRPGAPRSPRRGPRRSPGGFLGTSGEGRPVARQGVRGPGSVTPLRGSLKSALSPLLTTTG